MIELLSAPIVQSLTSFKRLVLAYSGGMDSEVLLHALSEHAALKKTLIAVHVNHQLSTQANDWQEHCRGRCQQLNVPFVSQTIAIENTSNLEEKARIGRYRVFKALLNKGDALLTAHHQSDLVETLLLNLCRGSGLQGLSAMPYQRPFENAELLRPLIEVEKSVIVDYAKEHQLSFVEDESNQDSHYRRNFLRHQVLPLLREKWPHVETSIAKGAKNLKEAALLLEKEDSARLKQYLISSNQLSTNIVLLEPALRKRVICLWLKNSGVQALSCQQLEQLSTEIIKDSPKAQGALITSQYQIRRFRQSLYLIRQEQPICHNSSEKRLGLEKTSLNFNLSNGQFSIHPSKTGPLAYPTGATFSIRYRQGGELFKQNAQSKKLKKLLAELSIPPWIRESTPLLYINDELAAISDRLISDSFKPYRHENRATLSFNETMDQGFGIHLEESS